MDDDWVPDPDGPCFHAWMVLDLTLECVHCGASVPRTDPEPVETEDS